MSRLKPRRQPGIAAGMALLMLAAAGPASIGSTVRAQSTTPSAAGQSVELEPLRCWWKTDKSAVHIAERFTLTLTCATVETSRTAVVADVAQLEPTAIQLTPFEVMSGSSPPDLYEPPFHYFQREYTVRLLGERFFGQDVDIPPLPVSYTIRTAEGDGAIEGRAQTYSMPSLPLRILSLVPKKATDIQDFSEETFSTIEARRARATEELVAAAILFAFAALLVIFAGVRLFRRRREHAPVVARTVPSRDVLRGCLHAIKALRTEVAADGWTPERAGRALSAFRVAAAVAMRKPVTQVLSAEAEPEVREGQLAVRTGLLRRERVAVSAPVTADAIQRHLTTTGRTRGAARAAAVLEPFRELLRTFRDARYGRAEALDPASLDLALETGTRLVRQLRVTHLFRRPPVRASARLALRG